MNELSLSLCLRPQNREDDKILLNEMSVLCVYVSLFPCLKFLVGKWNELGSVMTIQPSDYMSFEGSYKTQVGAEEKGPVPLYGVMNPIKTANPTFTFCVAWNVDKGM